MKDKILKLGYSEPEVNELIKVSKDINKDYKKLINGYPIQYLIGYVNFYGYTINVNENVLIPRYETEYLVEKTIKYCNKKFNKKIDILDIGTGSGAMAISFAKELNANVCAIDISKEAIKVAKKNANLNNVKIDFIENNLIDNYYKKFDLIVSNPPYISFDEEIMESVKKYEPNIALYAEENGLYFYRKILENIKKNLNNDFIIAFEIGITQAENIKRIIKDNFDNVIIKVEKDLSNRDRFIFIISE